MHRLAPLLLLFALGCTPAPSLTAYHATWCHQCRVDEAQLDALRQRITITDIDVDRQPTAIKSVPFYVLYVDGVEVVRTNDLQVILKLL